MAETITSPILHPRQYDTDFFREYVTENLFAPYMGAGKAMGGSIIQVNEDLSKKKGESIIFPLVAGLKGRGVQGNTPLDGNEEEIGNYGWPVPVNVNRNGVKITEWEEQKSAIDYFDEARPLLKDWAMESLRGGTFYDLTGLAALANPLGIIDNMYAFYDGTSDTDGEPGSGAYALYPNASETIKDAWLANNADRVLFGAAFSNNSGNDHSASLLNVDSTNDKFTAAALMLMKQRATQALAPRIRPYRAKMDRKWYVAFAQPNAFRDFAADTVIQQANREAWERYSGGNGPNDNPLFVGGDLIYNGVIIREIPEMPVIPGVGAAGIDVAPVFLCGVGAVSVAWAKRPTIRLLNEGDGADYGFRHGVGVMEFRGVRATYFQGKMFGMVRAYFSGVASV